VGFHHRFHSRCPGFAPFSCAIGVVLVDLFPYLGGDRVVAMLKPYGNHRENGGFSMKNGDLLGLIGWADM